MGSLIKSSEISVDSGWRNTRSEDHNVERMISSPLEGGSCSETLETFEYLRPLNLSAICPSRNWRVVALSLEFTYVEYLGVRSSSIITSQALQIH